VTGAERRRSRTYPAWGYQISPVLKINRAGLTYEAVSADLAFRRFPSRCGDGVGT